MKCLSVRCRNVTLRITGLLVAGALGVLPLAHASDLPASCTVTAYDVRLEARYTQSADRKFPCLSGQPVGDKLAAVRRAFYGSDAQTKGNSVGLLGGWPATARAQLKQRQNAAASLAPPVPGSFNDAVTRYRTTLDEFATDLAALVSVEQWTAADAKFAAARLPDYWLVNSSLRDEPGYLPARFLAAENCLTAAPSERCEAAYRRALELADEVFLVDEMVSIMSSKARSDFATAAASREARWHAYLYDTQFQFWWELALNRYVEARCPVWLRWDCQPLVTDPVGNEVGFREPPNQKLMFLHPDLGIEYLNHEANGQKLKPAILFQWFGYERWTWKKDAPDQLKGISLVTTVADTAKSKRVGFGLAFEYLGFMIAVTAHGSDVGVTFNTKVADQIGKINSQWGGELKAPLGK